MRRRTLLPAIGILFLVSGLFLAANATIIPHDTSLSLQRFGTGMFGHGQYFTFTGATLTPNNPPQIVVGTTTVGDAFILATSAREFSSWICYQLPASSFSMSHYDCSAGDLGGDFNTTILDAYLQTHPSAVVNSNVVIGQNVTLDYRVAAATNVTIVFARMTPANSTDYLGLTYSSQSVIYPVIGWTERSGSIFSLLNLSIGLASAGAVIVGVSIQITRPSSSISLLRRMPALGKCARCGGENLAFADKCRHCGTIIGEDSLTSPTVHTN